MARRRKTKPGISAATRQADEPRGFNPADYDDIDLSDLKQRVDLTQEFDDIDLTSTLPDSYSPSDDVYKAKKQLEEKLLLSPSAQVQAFSAATGSNRYGFENIVGVGIGEKMTGDHYTGQECVMVYVVSKEEEDNIAPEALVPEDVDGIPTDVVPVGEIHALPHRGVYRPVPSGVSIGNFRITAGTMACLVGRGRQLFVLSNNHVLANANNAQIGDPILQPGPYDGGKIPDNVVAKLSEFVPIRFDGSGNLVDCAIAQASPGLFTVENKCFGFINPQLENCQRFKVVKKCGRTTQLTRGIITDCNATVRVGYGTTGTAVFQDQIIITGIPYIAPFSQPGDSGSLVLSEFTNRPVGLLFAGSTSITIANKIQNVLSALNVSIIA